jgi:hypothetical protein
MPCQALTGLTGLSGLITQQEGGGGGSPPDPFVPSFVFSDSRNSQYIAAVF